MQVASNTVVSIDYTLRNAGGEVIDSSAGREPLEYLHGHGNIIPGLENELAGRNVGDKLKVEIAPEQGYGPHDASWVLDASRSQFPGDADLHVGMQFQATTPGGTRVFKVVSIDGDAIKVDGNHPLAGETLHFEVEVMGVRAAEQDEIESGRVGGHGDCCGGHDCGCRH